MQSFQLRNPEKLVEVYGRVAQEAPSVKNVVRGGSDLRKLDEAGSNLEFVMTYTFKPGRFAKEKTIVAVVPVKRTANGVFVGDVSSTVFRVLSLKKGNFEEEWSGNLEEAKAQLPDIASTFETDIEAIARAFSENS
jgi:hypothetical protein